jgi:hypothetical protein
MKSLLAAALTLAAVIATPGSAAHAAPDPAPASAAVTPADGWYLTAVEQGKPTREGIRAKRLRLELVAPDGERTTVLDVRQRGYRLVDWSPDGSTALLLDDYPTPRVLRVDVATGETYPMRLSRDIAETVLAPDGSGILAVKFGTHGGEHIPLVRIGWDGRRTRLSSDVDGRLLTTPDGSGVVDHGSGWHQKVIRVLSVADGSVQQEVPTPRACNPVRWWDDERLLVGCEARGGTTLGLVDLAASSYERLTARHEPQRMDLGHLDARRAGGRLYVQVAGPCGYAYVGRQHADGRITHLRVPGAVGNVLLVGARGDRLVLQHAISCDGAAPRSALALFDPATHREKRLVVLPKDEAFAAVLPYGERRPTGY